MRPGRRGHLFDLAAFTRVDRTFSLTGSRIVLCALSIVWHLLPVSVCSSARGLVRAFSMPPQRAEWSAWAADRVAQVFTCNFDSIESCELLVGASPGSRRYQLEIVDRRDGSTVALSQPVMAERPYCWLRFGRWSTTSAMAKGRQYELRFRRHGDSINFFYGQCPGYDSLGWMIVDGASRAEVHLSCRVYGRLRRVDTGWWGVNANLTRLTAPGHDSAVLSKARDIGVAWVRDDFTSWEEFDNNPHAVARRCSLYVARGFSILGMLCYGSPQSRISTKPEGSTDPPRGRDKYPPRNLWPQNDDDTAYWQRYVRAAMESLPDIKYWEVGNEYNCCSLYFGNPDTEYYGTREHPIRRPRERCSLYVRMCYLAESTARQLGGGRKIVAGSVQGLSDWWPPSGLSTGAEWIRDMVELGGDSSFDAISAHPYQHLKGGREDRKLRMLDADTFYADLALAHRNVGYSGARDYELWVTEVGWPLHRWLGLSGVGFYRPLARASPDRNAGNLCKFYVSSIASQMRARGGYDRVFWYELTDLRDDGTRNEGFGLLSSPSQDLKAEAYAYAQVVRLLTGKRAAGRAPSGVPTLVQLRQFEADDDARLWVSWSDDPSRRRLALARIPARTESLLVESLALAPGRRTSRTESSPDGWLRLSVGDRPVFVTEVGPVRRPDLVVDSVTVGPQQPRAAEVVTITAWVRNVGNATCEAFGVEIQVDGRRTAGTTYSRPVQAGNRALVQVARVRLPRDQRRSILLSLSVNPDSRFVELDHENNTGYRVIEF